MADYDHQSTSSGAMIESNDDLLTEILRRLPVISILRFKSVSKHWRSLLNDPHFILQYNNGSVTPGLFVRDLYVPYDVEKRTTPFRGLDIYPDHRRIKIVQSCNGLLLCCSTQGHGRARDYYVYNPTTKQCAIVPPMIGGLDALRSVRFMGLAFHQTNCPNYKLICIHGERERDEMLQIQIYSSETRNWKKTLNHSFWMSYYTPLSGGVYWNQAFHWAPSYFVPKYLRLDDERLLELPLPSPLPARVQSFRGYHDGVRPLYFGESRGHLHLVDSGDHENHMHLNVYEMLSDHSGWFIKYQVELDVLQATYPEVIQLCQQQSRPHYYKFEILDVVRGEKEEDTFMVIKVSKKIIRYNIMENSFKQIFDLTNTSYENIGSWDVHRYLGTIISF